MKDIGQACDGDKEYALIHVLVTSSTLTGWTGRCSSFNCQINGVCGTGADTPHQFGIWVYVLVGVGIIGGVLSNLRRKLRYANDYCRNACNVDFVVYDSPAPA